MSPAILTSGSFLGVRNSDVLWYEDGQGHYLGLEIMEALEQITQRVYSFAFLMLAVLMLQFQVLFWSYLADLPAPLWLWAVRGL